MVSLWGRIQTGRWVQLAVSGSDRCGSNVPLCSALRRLSASDMERSEKELRSDDEAEHEDEEVDPRIQAGLFYFMFIYIQMWLKNEQFLGCSKVIPSAVIERLILSVSGK